MYLKDPMLSWYIKNQENKIQQETRFEETISDKKDSASMINVHD